MGQSKGLRADWQKMGGDVCAECTGRGVTVSGGVGDEREGEMRGSEKQGRDDGIPWDRPQRASERWLTRMHGGTELVASLT